MSSRSAPSFADASPPSDECGSVHTVHVRFAPRQGTRLQRPGPAGLVPDWAERPLLLERADGTYDLIGTTTCLDGLVRWILSHGTDATVQAPDRLRRRVAREARRVWAEYQETPLDRSC